MESKRSRFVRWMQRTRDKLFGVWNEGPEPPARLEQIVLTFAEQHPSATRREWIEFSKGQLEEIWRTAWLRGFEHAERSPDPDFDPEEIANALDPDWKWRDARGINVEELDQVIPDAVDEEIRRR